MKNSDVFIFGAGGAASWVLAGFKRAGVAVKGFLDESDTCSSAVSGLPVYSPDDYRISKIERGSCPVIIAIMNPAVDVLAISHRLSGYGWRHLYSYAEFGKEELEKNGRHCGVLSPGPLNTTGKELAQVRKLLSDEHSQRLLDGFVNFVRTFDESQFPEIVSRPYFPECLPRWKAPLRIIDCGAFDGDTLRAAEAAGYHIEASASFEPDPQNYSRLAVETNTRIGAEAWPCGVAGKTGILKFYSQGDTGSSLNSQGDISVQCVALDDALPSFAPTLIKMDVEGAEEEALKGAERMLRRYSPELAISVYHRPEDIWRIPLWLYEIWGDKARYFLRRHSREVADTVLYVFPEKNS